MSCNLACSQLQKFIETVPGNTVPDNPEMSAYIARLKKNPNISNYHFIHLNPLATAQKEGTLTLEIPGKDKPIIAEASEVKYHSATDYEWIGKTDDNRGTIIILSKEGRITAHLSTPDGIYEIFPAPGGLYCLQKVDLSKGDDVGCIAPEEHSSTERTSAQQPEQAPPVDINAKMNPCQPLISPRVLVLYTPKALALVGNVAGIQTMADLSVAQFNSCIYNSGITSNAALTLAGIAPLNNLPETQFITNDLNNLEKNLVAQGLRDSYHADLVVLFTDGEYQGGDTRGKAQTQDLVNSQSYAIVELWSATSRKTFAHEVGHLYGCRHEDTPGSPVYAQAYCIKNGLGIVTDRTVMVGKSITDEQAKNRLLHFSNPNVQAGGKASGTNSENNAKRITESLTIVSVFRPNPIPPLVAYVDGPTSITTPGGKNYEVTYSCGSAPYSIAWHYSYDGVNYLPSNITTDIFTWYFSQTQKIWIRATVKGNGKSVSAFITVSAQMPNPYKVNAFVNDSLASESAAFTVTPNPSSSEVVVSFNLFIDSNVQLEILDQSGKVITQIIDPKSFLNSGRQSVKWVTVNYPSGTYLARLLRNGVTETKRIIIAK